MAETDAAQIDNFYTLDNALRDLIKRCRHRLWLVGPKLTLPALLSPDISDQLRHLVIGHRDNEIRLLIDDEKAFLRSNTALTRFARRHDSHVTLRVMPTELSLPEEFIAVGDNGEVLHQARLSLPGAAHHVADASAANTFVERIKPWWDQAERPVELFTAGL